MKRVYADMVADLFHCGHMEFLKKARALGDYLLVGINSNDVLVSHGYKRGKPILTLEERVNSVAGCRYVDEVLPNAPFIIDMLSASTAIRLAPFPHSHEVTTSLPNAKSTEPA